MADSRVVGDAQGLLVVAEHELLTGEVNPTEFRRVLRERFKVPPPEIALVEDQLRSHVNEDPGRHNYEKDNRQAFYRMVGDFFFPGDKGFNPLTMIGVDGPAS